MWTVVRLLIAAILASLAYAEIDKDVKTRVFEALVEHSFGPVTSGHASEYYKTRFFTAQLQSRMRLLVSQYDTAEERSLSDNEAKQLNTVVQEMWRAARKLYHSEGCLSYDLTLCNERNGKQKLSDQEREALDEWEVELNTKYSTKELTKEEATKIHQMASDIQRVLLVHSE
ncbi:hypothetical protein IWW36_001273 [Coemansia brasiliensis]|uniref:Uncharacterized protein n=1 Tax=Coemansia brasiliensis TaxID=2650707 RepID=A0A9W8IH27_9FUNG|nr:hypothetical protein IWW36_001273 [Coemansia brasiliensis]